MGKVICHYQGRYNLYSTVSDRFMFFSSISNEELCVWIRNELGDKGVRELDERLKRAHAKGTSALLDGTLEESLCANRAGPSEKKMSFQKCIESFLS